MPTFYELLHKVTALLETEGRISYRAIKREFDVDDDLLEDLKTELVEVKQIARDVEGKALELVSAPGRPVAAAPPPEPLHRASPPGAERADQVPPAPSQPRGTPGAQTTAHAAPVLEERKPVKRSSLIWLGAACILVGVLLPWVSASVQLAGLPTQRYTVTGLELTQGLLSIAVGVFSSLMGFATARRTMPAKAVALVIIITGIVVLGVTLDAIDGVTDRDLRLPGFGGRSIMSVQQSPEPGVFITLLGGGLLSLGGLIALIRARKQSG